MSRKELAAHVQIDAWAQESVTKHRRECTEKICGGKQKIWWTVRHPKVHKEIASDLAKSYVINKLHVCAPLLARLATPTGIEQDHDESQGSSKILKKNHGPMHGKSTMIEKIPWLPGEFNVYVNRSDLEVAQLIGREEIPEETVPEVDMKEVRNPFPEVMKSFPETRSADIRRAYVAGRTERNQREQQRTQPAKGLGAAVDALSRSQNGR